MIEAIRSAMDVSMARDDNVVVFGEDVGYFGGVFRCTQGLQQKYGKRRCFDTPISELGIVGAAIGMAAYGLRPCVEMQFADYIYPAYDQIVSEAARLRYRSNGQFTCPIVVRMPTGGGIFGGQTHSQSPEALFTHVSGLKVVVPSNPHDAKGLLIAAIEDPDPVIFLEPKRLYNGPFDGHHDRPVTPWSKHDSSETPDGHYLTPLGKAAIRREGGALTILAYGTMVYVAEAAADEAGVDAEIIDLRTLLPLDLETIAASVNKTGRCVVVHEATLTRGFGAELAALVQETCFYPPRGAGRAGDGVGHALSARARVGLFPRLRRGRPRAPRNSGGVSMGEHVIKLPDVGEGVAEAELVEWRVKVGDLVREDAILAAVMTDKATVEIPSPVSGEVALARRRGRRRGRRGLADDPAESRGRGRARASLAAAKADGAARRGASESRPARRETAQAPPPAPRDSRSAPPRAPRASRPLASPAVRLRAREAGVDLRQVQGSGPAGRIGHRDLEAFIARGPQAARATGLRAEQFGRGRQARRAAPENRREDGAGARAHRRTSPMSRRSTSPRSRSCAPRSTSRSEPTSPS